MSQPLFAQHCPCLLSYHRSPPPVSKWCLLLLWPAHSCLSSGYLVLDSILLQPQLSAPLSLHMLLGLLNSCEFITTQSQHLVPHFPHTMSQGLRDPASPPVHPPFCLFLPLSLPWPLFLLFFGASMQKRKYFCSQFFCFVLQGSLEELLQAQVIKDRQTHCSHQIL